MEKYSLAPIKKEIAEEKRREREEENTSKIGGKIGVKGLKIYFD